MNLIAISFVLSVICCLLAVMPLGVTNLRRLVLVISWIQFALIASFVTPLYSHQIASLPIFYECSVDRISGSFLLLTYFICAVSLTHSATFFAVENQSGALPSQNHEKQFYAAAQLLILAMSLVFITENLGILWVAIEATTLFSAPFVYFRRTKHAIEATWKYLIICSVGIAFAFLGTILIFASSQGGSFDDGTLNFSALCAEATHLQTKYVQLGYLFCLLGYGTKAGLFPLHTWLPDAYSESPSPASAILSGALVNCSLFAIFRITQLVSLTGLHSLASALPLTWGAMTAFAASLFLLNQRELKRLWAYSSVENVGLMLASIGLGLPSLFFLQALNHGLAKVALFLVTGNIIQHSGSNRLSKTKGVLTSAPIWGLIMALAAAAVTGMPPFGSFISELLLLSKTSDANQNINLGLIIVALTLSFIAISVHVSKVLWGVPGRHNNIEVSFASSAMPLILCICALLCGFTGIPHLFFHNL